MTSCRMPRFTLYFLGKEWSEYCVGSVSLCLLCRTNRIESNRIESNRKSNNDHKKHSNTITWWYSHSTTLPLTWPCVKFWLAQVTNSCTGLLTNGDRLYRNFQLDDFISCLITRTFSCLVDAGIQDSSPSLPTRFFRSTQNERGNFDLIFATCTCIAPVSLLSSSTVPLPVRPFDWLMSGSKASCHLL
jgi:hypothetical protein